MTRIGLCKYSVLLRTLKYYRAYPPQFPLHEGNTVKPKETPCVRGGAAAGAGAVRGGVRAARRAAAGVCGVAAGAAALDGGAAKRRGRR